MCSELANGEKAAALEKPRLNLDTLKLFGEPFLLLGLFQEPCLQRWGAYDRGQGAQAGCLTFVVIGELRPLRQQAIEQLTQSIECIAGDPLQLVGLTDESLLLLYVKRRAPPVSVTCPHFILLDGISARRTACFDLNS